MKSFFSLLCASIFLFSGCGGIMNREPEPEPVVKGKGVLHPVAPGETLPMLSQAYGVSVQDLMKVNGIEDPNRIQEGFMLYIPGAISVIHPTGAVPVTTDPKPVKVSKRSGPITAENKFIWPVQGTVIGKFKRSSDPTDECLGIKVSADKDAPIKAAKSGKVEWVAPNGVVGYGRLIFISHTDGHTSVYGHCSKIMVEQGDWVQQGDVIGLAGTSGDAASPRLFFQISRKGVELDPQSVLP